MSYLRHINLLKAFPGARMSGIYTVAKATEKTRGTSKTTGHDYVIWNLVLDDGTLCEFNRRKMPNVGERIEGSLEKARYGDGMILKPERLAPGQLSGDELARQGLALKDESLRRAGSPQSHTGVAPRGTPNGWKRDPAEQKSIIRQHSQQMALMWCQARCIVDKTTDVSVALVKRLTDWFQADAEGKDPGAFIP